VSSESAEHAEDETVCGPAEPVKSRGPGRRSFLRGMAGGVAGGVVAGGIGGAAGGYAYRGARADTEVAADPAAGANLAALEGRLPAVPFHGEHQAGILPGPKAATAVISFNATASSRAELTELFQTLTDRARFLTAGGTPPPVGIGGPPSDSGTLGPVVVPDGLTVTFGVGSTLFDDRYGLASKLPGHLTPMKSFPNDDLDPAQCGGDLILQLSAGHEDVVLHALRDIAKHTRGGMQAKWRVDGFSSPARPAGTVPRNQLGFMDGIANPSVTSPSYVKPPAYENAHPGNSDPLEEQQFVVNTVNQIEQSKYWPATAIILTYDDSDGWYDHATPPIVSGSNDSTAGTTGNMGDTAVCTSVPITVGSAEDRCGYGDRLPFLVISPYTRENYVSSKLLNTASVVKFIEDNWLRGKRIPGSFDAVSGSIDGHGGLLDFNGTPHVTPVILNPTTGAVVSGDSWYGGKGELKPTAATKNKK
jgi:Dyp-type peroxidase, N-terminal/Phosphoesterase family